MPSTSCPSVGVLTATLRWERTGLSVGATCATGGRARSCLWRTRKGAPLIVRQASSAKLIQMEEQARITWLGETCGLGKGESLHTDLSDLAFRWNCWTRQPREVNNHTEVKAAVRLMDMVHRTIPVGERQAVMAHSRLAIHHSQEQAYLRREAEQRKQIEEQQRIAIQKQKERSVREKQHREKRLREEEELQQERLERQR